MTDIYDVQIKRVRGHYEVTVNGKFFCSADTFMEAVHELEEESIC